MQQIDKPLTSPEKFQIARLRVIKGMRDGGFLSETDYNKERLSIIDNMVGIKSPSTPPQKKPSSTLLTPPTTTPTTPTTITPLVQQQNNTSKQDNTLLNSKDQDGELILMKEQFKDFKIMVLAKLQIFEEGFLVHFKSMKSTPNTDLVNDTVKNLSASLDQFVEQFTTQMKDMAGECKSIREELDTRNQSDYDNKLIEIEEEVANLSLHTHQRFDDIDQRVSQVLSEVENTNVDMYKKLGETVTLFTHQNQLSSQRLTDFEKKIHEDMENFKTQSRGEKEQDMLNLDSKMKGMISKMKEKIEGSQLSSIESELLHIKQKLGIKDDGESPVPILDSKVEVLEQMKALETKLEFVSAKQTEMDYSSLIPILLKRIDALEEKVKQLEVQN